MSFHSARIPYRQTGFFTNLVLDYLDRHSKLDSLFTHSASPKGIDNAIQQRRKNPVDRKLLTQVLTQQYAGMTVSEKLRQNLEALGEENCFTVTTAHQNNLFMGPLYFVYKILHAIKLASHLAQTNPDCRFVPVFYMGTEDADLAELDHAIVDGLLYQWKTSQTGAVGHMTVDSALQELIRNLKGQLSLFSTGTEIVNLLQEAYQPGKTIKEATFYLLNQLFGRYGLVVLMPDNSLLKSKFKEVMKEELLETAASTIVENAVSKLSQAGYKVQAKPRDINLFYLNEGVRQRIERNGAEWIVQGTTIRFNREELLIELDRFPERFSPNVILRGLYQCSLLPDVAFIGGGGELAYWLEYSDLFAHFKVPMPVLVLRNSFLLIEPAAKAQLNKLQIQAQDIFETEAILTTKFLTKAEKSLANIEVEEQKLQEIYSLLIEKASAADPSLSGHAAALQHKALAGLKGLEKKMIRALKKRHNTEQHQLVVLKERLFPGGKLQERHDNVLYYLSKYGEGFLDELLTHSLSVEQEFTILELA